MLTGLSPRAPREACNWVPALFIDEGAEAQRDQGLGHAASERRAPAAWALSPLARRVTDRGGSCGT